MLNGETQIKLTGASLPDTLNRLSDAGIRLRELTPVSELECTVWVPSGCLPMLGELCRKRGDAMKTLRSRGVTRWREIGRRHWGMAVLWLFLLGVTLFLPSRILFIEVTGNERIETAAILEAAEESGLRFWGNRRQLRSERIKNEMLLRLPQLKWIGINTSGCRAVISVAENPPEAEAAKLLGDITAAADGIVAEISVQSGIRRCEVGQAVLKGDVLIAAEGIAAAEGEVFALTRRRLTAKTPLYWQKLSEKKTAVAGVSLVLGKKRINLWQNSRNPQAICGRIRRQFPWILPGGFRLPAAIEVETEITYTVGDTQPPEDFLETYLNDYLTSQMLSGRRLFAAYYADASEKALVLTGDAVCYEMIGRSRPKRIGEYHEQGD